ncbi:unnamed protein product [Chrysoparadoxa australica]
MIISLDWIKDFSKISEDLSPEALGLRLTMGTAEVEGVEEVNQFWKEIRVVEVTHIEQHPEADKLNLVSFKWSDTDSFRVVCGASNVRVGMKTAFAPVGTTLPIGLTLEPKKIRGVLSEGMLCSEEELGLADESAGILDMPADTPLGVDLATLWEKKLDVLFDIDNKSLTHRPDLWGHFGMAREFSALYETDFVNPFSETWKSELENLFGDENAPIKVKVEKDSSCLAYFGLSVDGIKVGESPAWIKDRLLAVGLRPINNIVDISNYVMLELGMPLHIFDREEIKGGEVRIHALDKDSDFITLDETERKLITGDTVISDSEKPLVLAGIMGGLNSGVTEKTDKIFIEVANWQAAKVRRTSTRLGLRTDSSMRYEKTLDSQLCYRTLLRTLELVKKLCPDAKVVGAPQYDGDDLSAYSPLKIQVTVEVINKTLGKEISTKEIVEILERLDFKVTKGDEHLEVVVPSYRSTKDIECAADIIEEVGRVIGYDNISPEGPELQIRPVRLSQIHEMKRKSQDFLSTSAKSYELTTYPLIGEALLKKSNWVTKCEGLQLINSLSVDHDRMRDSLIPSFLEVASSNAKNFENFRFFEFGRTYLPNDKTFYEEQTTLGICFYNKSESPIITLQTVVEQLSAYLNIPFDFVDKHPKFKSSVVDESWIGLHPYEFKNMRIMGKMNGAIFSIHPKTLKDFKIKGHLSMAMINLSPFEKTQLKAKVAYKPLPKFPSSRFDYTVTLESDQRIEDIFSCLKKIKFGCDNDHKIVDIYQEKGDSRRFVTMATILNDPDKTLPGEFIKECEEKIISKLSESKIPLKSS